jgi:hypothetical protein
MILVGLIESSRTFLNGMDAAASKFIPLEKMDFIWFESAYKK